METFINCLNPKFILNRYTGKEVLIECGQCESCRMKKSALRTTLCKLESTQHRWHYFVTLTYSNENLPKARLVATNEELNIYDVVRESDGLVCGSVFFQKHIDKVNLCKKCNTTINTLPILEYRDVQLFIKRLRKTLKDEKIRFFCCGEYGNIHFRPHYHLSLWSDQEQETTSIIQAIYSSWTLGRVDASLSSGKSTSYVASYINSNQYLPRVFKLSKTAPFSRHSIYLGEQFYKSEIQKPQEAEFATIAKKRLCFNGFNSDVFLWRSLKDKIFPKFKGFAQFNERQRVLSYQCYAILRNWSQETKPIYLARFVTDYVKYEDFYHPIDEVNELLQLFRIGLNFYVRESDTIKLAVPTLLDYTKFERMVYVMILNSRKFLKLHCNGNDSYINVQKRIQHIERFYQDQEYDALKAQLQTEQEMSRKGKPIEYLFHNTLILDDYKNSTNYFTHKSSQITRFSSFVKHKELNDKNKIFNY